MPNVRLLIVDDEDINRQTLRYCLEPAGFQIDEAGDGAEAWQALCQGGDIYDAILLDRRMPEMDGMELLAKIKAESGLRDVPVIMQTAMDREQEIIDGIEAGVHYYLTKPYDVDVLVSVVRSATEEYARHCRLQTELAKRSGAIQLMTQGTFVLRSPKEADALAVLLASSLPRSSAVAMGFSELLINAIEHGNLELNYAEKSVLLAEGRWDEAIEARLSQEPYCDRRVTVEVTRTTGRAVFTIADEGKGFDWQAYMDLTMERVFDTHGRGIAMARRMSFSTLNYKGRGNVVEASVEFEEPKTEASVAKPSIDLKPNIDGDVEERLRGISQWDVTSADDEASGLVVSPVSQEISQSDENTDRAIKLSIGELPAATLELPADPDLVEAVVRCLILPETMELGTADENRLAPALFRYQSQLLPNTGVLGRERCAISAWSAACSSVSGDIWGGFDLGDGKLALFVADMTGHGPVAGLNTLRLWALMSDMDLVDEAPDAVLRRLDEAFKPALPTGQYAAMIYGIIDSAAGRFEYAAAGVPHPVVFDRAGGHVASGSGKGLPVGAGGNFPYELRSLDMPAGGALVLFTDGLIALLDEDHKKAHAFDRFLANMAGSGAEDAACKRLADLISAGPNVGGDDLTALCVTLAG
ncbi:MAG: SpoIIE family protein phosphatase [Rhodospirillales bacterium]